MNYSIKVATKHSNTYRVEDGVQVCWGWAKDTFGTPHEGQWWYTDVDGERVFHFMHEADATMFALKWA